MSAKKKPANELRIIDPQEGESPDAALHEALLAKTDGHTDSDLRAVSQAVRRGIDITKAARLFAGPVAVAKLAAAGLIDPTQV